MHHLEVGREMGVMGEVQGKEEGEMKKRDNHHSINISQRNNTDSKNSKQLKNLRNL